MYRKAGQILLSTFLATGWGWTKLLEDAQIIDSAERFWFSVVLTVVLILQQIYLILPLPAERAMLESRRTITEAYLKGFINSYYETLASGQGDQGVPIVRANIMLPHKKLKGLLGTYLKIGYYVPHKNMVYTEGELTLEWQQGDGTCGWAWQTENITVFDSENPDLRSPSSRLGDHQKRVVKRIKSTLSIPIRDDHHLVGILNIDSKQNISQTRFTDDRILALATACAHHVSAQCFKDGVKG